MSKTRPKRETVHWKSPYLVFVIFCTNTSYVALTVCEFVLGEVTSYNKMEQWIKIYTLKGLLFIMKKQQNFRWLKRTRPQNQGGQYIDRSRFNSHWSKGE